MKKITFEMARELGLIPYPTDRYLSVQFMFESYQGYKDRQDSGERAYRAEMEQIKNKYKIVQFRGETLEVI